MRKEKEISRFEWFGNDADGLSLVDIITCIMFLYFIITKSLHFYIAVHYANTPEVMKNTIIIMDSINQFTDMMFMFYFGKKTLDTTVTKIGLFRTNSYEKRNIISVPTGDDLLEKSLTEISDGIRDQISTYNKELQEELLQLNPEYLINKEYKDAYDKTIEELNMYQEVTPIANIEDHIEEEYIIPTEEIKEETPSIEEIKPEETIKEPIEPPKNTSPEFDIAHIDNV